MQYGVVARRGTYRCFRCGNYKQQYFARFYDEYAQQVTTYCRLCVGSQQANTLEPLQAIRTRKTITTPFMFRLPFPLTTAQKEAFLALKQHVHAKQRLLLQAVCGAGKTEIIATLIAQALQRQQYIGWAIARKDVVIEITDRLRTYFPCTKIIGLYQNSPDLEEDGQLIVLTTARLYDFYHFFDILIIDENDAFPFSIDAGQKFAAKQAIINQGVSVHISATILKQQRHEYDYIKSLARRFHDCDLPQITFLRYQKNRWSFQTKIAKKLRVLFETWREQGFPVFIFVSNKKLGRQFTALMQKVYGDENTMFVSSEISDRTPILQAVRHGKLPFLVTTTILERGVTYRDLQVIVLDADAPLFDAQTLIQIAGRVGRNALAPNGSIIFCYQTYITRAMRRAQVYHRRANEGEVMFL